MSGMAEPVSYPGNPALPREVRDKILSTFRHTLNLFKEGKSEDCVIGCDFILKMDPRFAPARQLMEKAKNPAAAVDVGTLEAIVAATPTRQERVASVESDRLLVRAAESLNARDFDAAITAAEEVLKTLPGNQNAGAILQQARQRKEAQPQFEVARQRAMAALDGRRPAEARAALEKMRLLDPEHPSVALLERRLAEPAADAPVEAGDSTNPGLSLDASPLDTGSTETPLPDMAPPEAAAEALDNLSLDSLSLDEPSPAYVRPPKDVGDPVTGPLSLGGVFSSQPEPPNLWNDGPSEDSWSAGLPGSGSMAMPDDSASAYSPAPAFSPEPAPAAAEASPQQEVESLLAKGDDASRAGNKQQAIEMWSRIFLIDINNSEAVGRIEAARKEMAEGNRRVAESLKGGREKFEAGDFTAAREAFLEVLAVDESDATARSYLDRIEQKLARPSSGLDLSRKAPAGDILAEEMAETAEPELAEEPEEPRARTASAAKAPRRPMDRRFVLALGSALALALAVGGYFLLRSGGSKTAPPPSTGGATLEHATMLFREGKLTETVAELRQIAPGHPDYARAQKLLASLTRNQGDSAPAGPGGESAPADGSPAASSGPAPEALQHRETAEKALSEKRYIDALKSFNLAAPAFSEDPSFSQLMGSASERVSELTPAVKLYNEGEYETAIPILWRIFQGDRANQDAKSYLLRSYYNQGIAQLQNGLYAKAAESFGEVIAVDPGDAASARHKKFAERYGKGDLDLMGRIYVRHIQQRP